jgi:hypothetical protein
MKASKIHIICDLLVALTSVFIFLLMNGNRVVVRITNGDFGYKDILVLLLPVSCGFIVFKVSTFILTILFTDRDG